MSEDHTAIIEFLADRFPSCFAVKGTHRKPLAVGIARDILERVGHSLTPAELSAALRVYTGSWSYLESCREGAPRIGLDGNAAGVVTARETAHAERQLAQLRAKRRTGEPGRPAKPLPSANAGQPQRLGLADLKAAWATRQAKRSLADG